MQKHNVVGGYTKYVFLHPWKGVEERAFSSCSAKNATAIFSLALVSLFICKNYATDIHKIRWKGALGPRKKRLHFGGNPNLDPDTGIFF